MSRIDFWRPLRVFGGWVWWAIEVIRWPLPERAAYRAVVVLSLVLLPFLPFELITVPQLRWVGAALVITLALWACVDRAVAALLILLEGRQTIRAKQLGRQHDLSVLRELHESPWSGLPLLLFVILVVGCTVAIGASSVTYSAINHLQMGDVFRSNSGDRLAVFLYFADEAARGVTFRLCDELGIVVPEKLQVVHYLPFTLLMWAYKNAFLLLVVQAGWFASISLFAEVEPEVKGLSEQVRQLRGENFELRRVIMQYKRERILALQKQHGGNLLPDQRRELEEQKNILWGKYLPEYDEINKALRWDDDVNGRIQRRGHHQRNRGRRRA